MSSGLHQHMTSWSCFTVIAQLKLLVFRVILLGCLRSIQTQMRLSSGIPTRLALHLCDLGPIYNIKVFSVRTNEVSLRDLLGVTGNLDVLNYWLPSRALQLLCEIALSVLRHHLVIACLGSLLDVIVIAKVSEFCLSGGLALISESLQLCFLAATPSFRDSFIKHFLT